MGWLTLRMVSFRLADKRSGDGSGLRDGATSRRTQSGIWGSEDIIVF